MVSRSWRENWGGRDISASAAASTETQSCPRENAESAVLIPSLSPATPDLLHLNVMETFTALNNMNMVVCNCINWAKLELQFPEFLSYTIPGWS